MKKILNQTIIVCALLNLITAGIVFAQDAVGQQKQVAKAKEKEVAKAGYGIATDMYKNAYGKIRSTGIAIPQLHHGGDGSVLVVPTGQMKIEDLAAINEDMNVMSRIFDRKLGGSDVLGRSFVRLDPFFRGGNRTARAIYLEGYGALFLMRVNMLLSAPPEAPKEEKAEGEDTDPLWEEVRIGLYEPEEARRSRSSDRPEEKYSALLVENLKANLIKTLKHATNIRGLEPEQLVIITVMGKERQSDTAITRSFTYNSYGDARRIVTVPQVEKTSLVPTVMTICAKRSDIDAFAKGEIDYDQFRQRTSIFKSYAKAGQQTFLGLEEYKVAEAHTGF
jgi:hypothetical protein